MDGVSQVGDREVELQSVALLDALLKVAQVVRIRLNDWLNQFELNDGRFGVLTALANAGASGLSQTQLADILCQSASNISTLIERMSRDGLVTRLPSMTDRRKRMLSISTEGRARLDLVESRRPAWAGRVFSMLDSVDRLQMFAGLQRLETQCGTGTKISKENSCAKSQSRAPVPVHSAGNRPLDPSTDPCSPHFALQQMLVSMSSRSLVELGDERVVA